MSVVGMNIFYIAVAASSDRKRPRKTVHTILDCTVEGDSVKIPKKEVSGLYDF